MHIKPHVEIQRKFLSDSINRSMKQTLATNMQTIEQSKPVNKEIELIEET